MNKKAHNMKISPKENLLRVLRHQEPAYIPYGMEATVWVNHRDSLFYRGNGDPNAVEWIDPWGVGFRLSDISFKDSAFPVSHPADSIDDLDSIPWPDPDDPAVFAPMKSSIADVDRSQNLVAAINPGVLFVRSWLLLGMENLFEAILTEEAQVEALLERITEYQVTIAKHTVALGVDIATLHDDSASNLSLYINPDLWRKLVKPRLKRIVDVYKDGGCIVMFHCCGHVMQILDDIVEMGFDFLNPIQASANPFPELRARTQGKLALFGGINADSVVRKTPEEVANLTYDAIYDLGQQGNYVAFADQVLPFPDANLAAMEQVIDEIGTYPLAPRSKWRGVLNRDRPSAGRMLQGS